MHLPTPEWIWHRMLVQGPADDVQAFAHAVAGPGVIPWEINYSRLEEDWFYRTLDRQRQQGHRTNTIFARRLAQQMRELTWQMHEGAEPPPTVAIDLNRVVPVPGGVLSLGVTHPDAIDWLWQHWGTTWPLRHVRRAVATDGGERAYEWAYTFYAADWTPWAAIAALRSRFTSLTFDVRIAY